MRGTGSFEPPARPVEPDQIPPGIATEIGHRAVVGRGKESLIRDGVVADIFRDANRLAGELEASGRRTAAPSTSLPC